MNRFLLWFMARYIRHLQKLGVGNTYIAQKLGLRLSVVHSANDMTQKLKDMIKNGEITEDMSYGKIAELVGFRFPASAKYQLDKIGWRK